MKIVGTVRIERPNYERVPTADGNGFTSRRAGTHHAQVTIYVDERALANAIGWKAVNSKGGRSRLQAGAVIVECDWQEVKP